MYVFNIYCVINNVLEIKLRATSVSKSLGLMFPEWQIAVILLHSVYRAFFSHLLIIIVIILFVVVTYLLLLHYINDFL
jgi:hypothetical protein